MLGEATLKLLYRNHDKKLNQTGGWVSEPMRQTVRRCVGCVGFGGRSEPACDEVWLQQMFVVQRLRHTFVGDHHLSLAEVHGPELRSAGTLFSLGVAGLRSAADLSLAMHKVLFGAVTSFTGSSSCQAVSSA